MYYDEDDYRREAIIMIHAATGYKRAVRGIVGRCIRSTLGVPQWGVAPHYVECQAASDADNAYGVPVFRLHVTDDEMERLVRCMRKGVREHGFNSLFDALEWYHD